MISGICQIYPLLPRSKQRSCVHSQDKRSPSATIERKVVNHVSFHVISNISYFYICPGWSGACSRCLFPSFARFASSDSLSGGIRKSMRLATFLCLLGWPQHCPGPFHPCLRMTEQIRTMECSGRSDRLGLPRHRPRPRCRCHNPRLLARKNLCQAGRRG